MKCVLRPRKMTEKEKEWTKILNVYRKQKKRKITIVVRARPRLSWSIPLPLCNNRSFRSDPCRKRREIKRTNEKMKIVWTATRKK
jgi:hypothetical protein